MLENSGMESYYAKRAQEYETIYLKPERQEYIKESKIILKKYFEGKTVLEIACGTGFWTETISEVSKSILAIDINNEMLEIAKNKKYNCKIDFIQDDSYKLEKVNGNYDSLFSGFWFSHIPKSKIKIFFDIIHNKLNENAIIVFMDNMYVDGSSIPITRFDTDRNSYQIRKLKDNSQYEIFKNFYSVNELKDLVQDYDNKVVIKDLKYYWILKYNK